MGNVEGRPLNHSNQARTVIYHDIVFMYIPLMRSMSTFLPNLPSKPSQTKSNSHNKSEKGIIVCIPVNKPNIVSDAVSS